MRLRERITPLGFGWNPGLPLGRTSWFGPTYEYGADTALPAFPDVPFTSERCLDELHPGPPYRMGGNFRLFRREAPYTRHVWGGTVYSYNRAFKYEGNMILLPPSLPDDWDTVFNEQDYSYAMYGATAYNKFKPCKPGADLGVFIGEIKDVPRMLRSTAQTFKDIWRHMGGSKTYWGPKRVANEFLSTQFGWLPFVNDCRKFYNTYRTLHNRIQRIREENGKWVRHGGLIRKESSSQVIYKSDTVTAHFPVLFSQFYKTPGKTGSHELKRTRTQEIWFEGYFRYWIKDIQSVVWEANAVRQLFGANLSPQVLWELMPWSWLVDWFTNASDIFGALDPGLAENLASKTAYIMGHLRDAYVLTSRHELLDTTMVSSATYCAEHKLRDGASPFGFGLTFEDFSPRQLSILSAVGLQRSPWRYK